jgi:hypothetical protein
MFCGTQVIKVLPIQPLFADTSPSSHFAMNPDAGPIVKSSTAYLFLASTSLVLVRESCLGLSEAVFVKSFKKLINK